MGTGSESSRGLSPFFPNALMNILLAGSFKREVVMSRVVLVVLGLVLVMPVSARATPVPDDALQFRGKSLGQWVKSLADPDPATRAAAADTIAVIGPEARPAVPALRKLLEDEDAKVRRSAVKALGEIGPEAAGTAAGLGEAHDTGQRGSSRGRRHRRRHLG